MKTFIKSILYFSFAALVFSGCAKNDDFSIPTIVDPAAGLKETKSIEEIYNVITKKMTKYENDDIIKGIIVSSDKEQTFFKEIYFVDEKNNKAAVFKLDKYSTFVDYEIGSTVYIKLKDTYVQLNNGILSIGGQNGNFVGYLADPIYKKHIFASNKNRLSLKDLEANYLTEITLEQALDTVGYPYVGKLIRLKDVQFDKDARGKTFVRNGEKATVNKIESKDKVVNKLGGTIGFRVASQNTTFSDKIVPNKSGTMTGVMTIFNKDFQFVPRFFSDLKLDKDPFEGDVTPPEEKKEGEGIDGVNQNTPTFVSNFNNWTSFILATNKYGIYSYAKEAKGLGKDGKGAMSIKGTPAGNDYVYTIENQTVVKGAKSISFWIKGSSAKSLSFNVFRANGTYAAYNLATDEQIKAGDKPVINKDLVIIPTKNMQTGNANNGNNNYATGSVNASNWIKITLDLSGVEYNTSGKGAVFAFKVGSAAAYDLLVTDIVFDGGKDDGGTTDPEVPGDSTLLVDFNNLSAEQALNFAKVVDGLGVNGKKALQFKGVPEKTGTAITLNDVKVPANAKKVTLKIKGSSVDRSLVFNIYKADAKTSNFYSLEAAEGHKTLEGKNSETAYEGVINTGSKWITVTLPLTDDVNKTGSGKFFDIRYGGKTSKLNPSYDLVIDNISFE